MTARAEEQLSMYPAGPGFETALYWLWLAHTLGAASPRAGAVLDWCGGDAARAWAEKDSGAFRKVAGQAAFARAARPNHTPASYRPLLARCKAAGIQILFASHPCYPLALARIADRPLVLYCTGNASWLNAPGLVGVVGSRSPDAYGLWGASALGRGLAGHGAVIVSGLADGLDSEGHRAALEMGAPTIGVQGVPIDRTYPVSNGPLRAQIEQNGCIVSEYAPGEGFAGKNGFLQRNRLIAGLSQALLVVQAREKSGTMSTVAHAERYGRPVYALPGDASRERSAGTNRLLQSGRARMALCAEDMLEALGLPQAPACAKAPAPAAAGPLPEAAPLPGQSPAAPAKAAPKAPLPPGENDRRVLACVDSEPQGAEELSIRCGLPAAAVTAALMRLEMMGRVRSLPGQQYILH